MCHPLILGYGYGLSFLAGNMRTFSPGRMHEGVSLGHTLWKGAGSSCWFLQLSHCCQITHKTDMMFEFNDDSHLGRPASAPPISRDGGPRWQHHSPDPDIARPVWPSSRSAKVLTDSQTPRWAQRDEGVGSTFHGGLLAGC